MNDIQIRAGFHRIRLRKWHSASDTLIVDELGLMHGKYRADIAVINGRLIGYEIKSDNDSLRRLSEQVEAYSAVFDRATIITCSRHLENVRTRVPLWWGITLALQSGSGAVRFKTVRQGLMNPGVDNLAVAQLLWRNEAEEELVRRGVSGKTLAQKRLALCKELVGLLGVRELRKLVREKLKSRTVWRCPAQHSLNDDSSQPCAK